MTHLGQWPVVDCKVHNCHWMPKVSSDKVTLRLLEEHQSQHLEKLRGYDQVTLILSSSFLRLSLMGRILGLMNIKRSTMS